MQFSQVLNWQSRPEVSKITFLLHRAWFFCKSCHDDVKDENLIKKCKCKNCKLSFLMFSKTSLIDLQTNILFNIPFPVTWMRPHFNTEHSFCTSSGKVSDWSAGYTVSGQSQWVTFWLKILAFFCWSLSFDWKFGTGNSNLCSSLPSKQIQLGAKCAGKLELKLSLPNTWMCVGIYY